MKIEDHVDKPKNCLSEGRIAELERNSATLHQIAALLCNDWLHESENIVVGISRLLAKLRSYQQEEAWAKYEELLEDDQKII